MRRYPRVFLLLALLLLISWHAYAAAEAETHGGSTAADLSVPIGKTVDDFTFSNGGALSYKGKPFNPAVKVNPDSVQSFRISLLKDWSRSILLR